MGIFKTTIDTPSLLQSRDLNNEHLLVKYREVNDFSQNTPIDLKSILFPVLLGISKSKKLPFQTGDISTYTTFPPAAQQNITYTAAALSLYRQRSETSYLEKFAKNAGKIILSSAFGILSGVAVAQVLPVAAGGLVSSSPILSDVTIGIVSSLTSGSLEGFFDYFSTDPSLTIEDLNIIAGDKPILDTFVWRLMREDAFKENQNRLKRLEDIVIPEPLRRSISMDLSKLSGEEVVFESLDTGTKIALASLKKMEQGLLEYFEARDQSVAQAEEMQDFFIGVSKLGDFFGKIGTQMKSPTVRMLGMSTKCGAVYSSAFYKISKLKCSAKLSLKSLVNPISSIGLVSFQVLGALFGLDMRSAESKMIEKLGKRMLSEFREVKNLILESEHRILQEVHKEGHDTRQAVRKEALDTRQSVHRLHVDVHEAFKLFLTMMTSIRSENTRIITGIDLFNQNLFDIIDELQAQHIRRLYPL